jgi:AraC-like DNA-binding protein
LAPVRATEWWQGQRLFNVIMAMIPFHPFLFPQVGCLDADINLIVNAALRGGATLLLLLLAASLLRDYSSLAARLGAAFAVGVAAFAISSWQGFAGKAIVWHSIIVAMATGNAIVFWLFSLAIFNDEFKLRPWHIIMWFLLALMGATNCFVFIPAGVLLGEFIGAVISAITTIFAAFAVAYAIKTWRADLVEGRRKLRAVIIGVIGTYTVAMQLAGVTSHHDSLAVLASTTNALGLASLTAFVAWHLLRSSGNELFAPQAHQVRTPLIATQLDTSVELPEPSLLAALEKLMQIDCVYREENLTIGALALKLKIPEHKLRRVINQGLGYRNFNTFLNRYRLAEAKTALGDPKKDNLPILTIALYTGFQSIGPFNRAFKLDTGITPTEYRRARP